MGKSRQIFFALCIMMLYVHSYAITVIKNIRVNGLQRIEIGTVFSYLPVKVGDTVTDDKIDEIIDRLYATGFFKDVRVEAQGSILIIDVQERPVISELSISGDKLFDHDLLVKSLKENGLAEGKIFDQGVLDQAVLSLKSEYYNRGLYSVTITPTVVPLERNRVSVSIAIDEGDAAKIVSIQFVGNKIFSQSALVNQMALTTGNLLSWWYKDNQYSSDKLSGDIETIRSYYLNRGYINFKINSIQVQLTPDKKSVYITVNLNEGSQYKIKSVKLAGDPKNVSKNELEKLILIKPGTVVDQALVNKTVDGIKTKLGDYGYAFAAVNPVPEIDEKQKSVGFTFFMDTGKRIYIRQINISGNDKTRDIVIRRELRQTENSLYNASAIQRSKDRLNLLGYFKNTDVATAPVAGVNDEVDMNVKVDENNTGSINFGIGYAQGQGLLLNGSISQSNLFGSGKSATLSASTSALYQSLSLSFTDPYYKPNGTSLGYDIYDNVYSPDQAGISPYSTQTIGSRVRMGVPVSEFDKINFSLGFENNQINLSGDDVPLRFIQFTDQFGSSVNAIPVSVGWIRNTTDSTLWPTTGATYNQTADATLPFVGVQYYRFTSQNTWFTPLGSDNYVWRSNAQFGTINAYNDSQVPFYQNYFLGGINSIRGYYIGTIGPKDTDGSTLGGTNEVVWTNDILFPMPGIKEAHVVRLSVFYDMGSLWGGNSFDLTPEQSFRASYGLGLTWISPLGPIKLTYAIPMFNQPNDNLQPFQFMLGTSF
ncbi:MAG: outer membrane protein insertion porin family [Pseudomonadota bacterium]|nr:outer membrane protein insertion porin family [Pseudomonadota bacterium]